MQGGDRDGRENRAADDVPLSATLWVSLASLALGVASRHEEKLKSL